MTSRGWFQKITSLGHGILDAWTWIRLKRRLALAPDEWGFICPYGVGDIYLVAALTHHFLKKNNASKIAFAVKPDQQFIPALFPEICFRAVLLNKEDLRRLVRIKGKKKGKMIIAHPYHQGFREQYDRILRSSDSFVAVLKKFLDLPDSAKLAEPVVDALCHEKVQRRLADSCLPLGKTVLLVPCRVSWPCGDLPLTFWELLAVRLRQEGWVVATNVVDDDTTIKETVPLRFPLHEAISICEKAGWVISVRSGFCDLVSSADCRLTVLYPQRNKNLNIFSERWNLKKMGLRDDAMEIVFDLNADLKELVERVVAWR